MEVAQGHVVKAGENLWGHLAAAAHKHALGVAERGPGGKAVGHQQPWQLWVQLGPYPVKKGAHTGGFPPQIAVTEEVPNCGGVAVGQQGELDSLAAL